MPFDTAPPLSHAGGRKKNQDYAAWTEADGATCWVLADGLGGHASGEVASEVAVEGALAAFRAQPDAEAATLGRCVERAQDLVHTYQGQSPDLESMRTTLTVLVADTDGLARWAHVGDSRLYVFREGQVVARTVDHSVPQALVASGEITPDEVRGHPDRNRLLRALGGSDIAKPTVSDIHEVEPGDAFLLCSDGFWELVTEDEMQLDLAETADPAGWLAAMERRLTARASGSHDNYSALATWAT